MDMTILVNKEMCENTYVIRGNRSAFVIDPGVDAEEIMAVADECGLKITDILLTHGHIDHICGVSKLRRHGAKVWASAKTSKMIQDKVNNLSMMFNKMLELEGADCIVENGMQIQVCGFDIKCILTPGHTDGCTSYLFENSLFTGDTLFLRSIGRSDLPTGNYDTLEKSIQKRIYTLDENITIYPGHGEKTSVGYEKKFNIFIKG